MLSNGSKVFLALVVAVGLTPLAAAHECTPGLIGIDLAHRVGYCIDPIVCILTFHVCPDPLLAADMAALAKPGFTAILP